MLKDFVRQVENKSTKTKHLTAIQLKYDPLLLLILLVICILSLFILYSASGNNMITVLRQATYMGIGFVVLLAFAQIAPSKLKFWIPLFYAVGIVLLIFVLVLGTGAKGAVRWISIPGFRFQPSEILKLATPLLIAVYLNSHSLPCSNKNIAVILVIIALPVFLVAKQPDLGTAILIALSGFFILFLAGFRFKYLLGLLILALPSCWLMWNYIMHDYQKQRVLTFLNRESDPLGAGWHIIQAKIAIGSGGISGKGYLHGSQSHLNFLPEGHTDFIFAVLAEEFGFIGILLLFSAYFILIGRCIYMVLHSHSTFCQLAGCGITLTFIVYIIVNIGMVSGLLPVVGVPLPLISRGGTSIITLLASFGILMSFYNHKPFMAN